MGKNEILNKGLYALTQELDSIIRKKKRLKTEFESLDAWMKTPMIDSIVKLEMEELEREGNKVSNLLLELGVSSESLADYIIACNGLSVDRYENCQWCSFYASEDSWRHSAYYSKWDERYGIPF